jgi:hypothetical protein
MHEASNLMSMYYLLQMYVMFEFQFSPFSMVDVFSLSVTCKTHGIPNTYSA